MKHVLDSQNPRKAPQETPEDTSQNLELRGNKLDEKINKLEEDLAKLREQIHQTGPGIVQETAKRRVLQILKRKRLYKTQRDQLSHQQFNLERVSFAVETARETMITYQLLKSAQEDLDNQMKSQQLDIKELSRIREGLIDRREDAQESLEQSDDVLEALGELEDLEGEMEGDLETLMTGQVPSYLSTPADAILPSAPVIIIPNKTPEETEEQEQDAYELSALPEII